MLELLRIKIDGFKMLEDNFTIDLTSKARVYQEDKTKEIREVAKGLYVFRSNSFVGGNSSGKSSVLSLILKTLQFFQTGRWEYIPREFNKDFIRFEAIFYLDGILYSYDADFHKLDPLLYSQTNRYSLIQNEHLYSLDFRKSHGAKDIDKIKDNGKNISSFLSSSLNDTSAIVKLTGKSVSVDDFSNNNFSAFNEVMLRKSFFNCLNSCSLKLSSSIIKLLDESIEYIKCENADNVSFKRFGEDEMLIPNNELVLILSAGTFRGVELYIRCINALKNGSTIIVDEIENSFQKNLVYNLLFLFNDEKINSKGSKLIFGTHYVEILDYLTRRDGIFITHKENGKINVKNLYSDYEIRTELLKSKQFDNNVFNTSINYKQLLEVKRDLLDELQINND